MKARQHDGHLPRNGEERIRLQTSQTPNSLEPVERKVDFQEPAEMAIAVAFIALKELQPLLEW